MTPDIPHDTDALNRIARDLQAIRSMLTEALNSTREAESEIPEKIRRFAMYFHDVRDFVTMHHSIGQEPPPEILKEIERCSDRFRHLLEDMYSDGGAFEKVRQDMTARSGNRYDHTKLLSTETSDEARDSEPQQPAAENRTDRAAG